MAKAKKKVSSNKKVGPAKTAKKRSYNNSSRSEQSAQTRLSIIQAMVDLLVERRGAEVRLDEVANRLGISERTIFRFFKDRKTLHQAMDSYLTEYLQASGEQMRDMDFVGFGKNAFQLFDKYENLTMAYVLSPFGHEARQLFRKKLNAVMIAKIVEERKLRISPTVLKRLALVTSLVNAKIWFDLKNDFGYSGGEMQEALDWALETLLKQV